jgi:hypothetical protein
MSSKSASQRKKAAHKGNASAQHGVTPYKAATAHKGNPPIVRKERGGWLTAAIIIMAVHGVFSTFALLSMRKTEYNQIPPWLYGTAILVGVATVVSAIALWYWKRWGLYLYVVATVASMAVGLIVFATGYAAIYNVIPLAILGYILQGQHKMQLLT